MDLLLVKHRDFLIERLDPAFGLIDNLISTKTLTVVEVNRINTKDSTTEDKNSKLIDCILMKRKASEFISALKDQGQIHLVNYLNSDGAYSSEFEDDWPLDSEYVNRLDVNRQYLVEHIDPTELQNQLISMKVISLWQSKYLASKTTYFDGNSALLDILRKCSIRQYKATIECLIRTNQDHVADTLVGGIITGQMRRKEAEKAKNSLTTTDGRHCTTKTDESADSSLNEANTLRSVSESETVLSDSSEIDPFILGEQFGSFGFNNKASSQYSTGGESAVQRKDYLRACSPEVFDLVLKCLINDFQKHCSEFFERKQGVVTDLTSSKVFNKAMSQPVLSLESKNSGHQCCLHCLGAASSESLYLDAEMKENSGQGHTTIYIDEDQGNSDFRRKAAVGLGSTIELESAKLNPFRIAWQQNFRKRAKIFYFVPFKVKGLISLSYLAVEDEYWNIFAKMIRGSSPEDEDSRHNFPGGELTVTKEFRYGQSNEGTFRFLVLGDKNDKMYQHRFAKGFDNRDLKPGFNNFTSIFSSFIDSCLKTNLTAVVETYIGSSLKEF